MDFLGPGIERIYQGVIMDVIKQVKEAFEDEGIGDDVLLELKKSWLLKLNQSDVLNIGPQGNNRVNRAPNPIITKIPTVKKGILDRSLDDSKTFRADNFNGADFNFGIPNNVAQEIKSIKQEVKPLNFKLGEAKKMDDSSSEEDSFSGDDDDKKLQAFAKLENEISGDECVAQEDPLNSDDDASSENETAEVYDVPNVVVCQFEKVGRNGKKWNFVLSEGVMNIGGKDYCFRKCTGDADW